MTGGRGSDVAEGGPESDLDTATAFIGFGQEGLAENGLERGEVGVRGTVLVAEGKLASPFGRAAGVDGSGEESRRGNKSMIPGIAGVVGGEGGAETEFEAVKKPIGVR